MKTVEKRSLSGVDCGNELSGLAMHYGMQEEKDFMDKNIVYYDPQLGICFFHNTILCTGGWAGAPGRTRRIRLRGALSAGGGPSLSRRCFTIFPFTAKSNMCGIIPAIKWNIKNQIDYFSFLHIILLIIFVETI